MKIAVFGGSGRTGQILVRKALEQGHEVRALVRTPSKMTASNPRLTLVQGNLQDRSKVAETIVGTDCVISLVGPGKGEKPDLMRSLAASLVETMPAAGVRRVIYITGAGVTQPEDPPALTAKVLIPIMKLLARDVLDDSFGGVNRLKASNLDWIVIRAPMLGDDPVSGVYRTGYIKPTFKKLPREDLADFILKQLNDNTWLRKLPIISK